MRPHILLRYSGIILLFNSAFLLLSSAVSLYYHDAALLPLLYSSLIAGLLGIFPILFVPPATDISNDEGFTIVVANWLVSCLVGILPYVLWGGPFTLTDAWFESVSGFTTTGATILEDIESLPCGLLFWRATTHWIGGIGIIVFTLSVIPSMGRAGMVLYRSEMSSLATESFRYRTQKTLQIIVMTYVGLTLAETIALRFCGLGLFDAVTHAFATIATGGFSTRNLSIAAFQNPAVEMVILFFMLASGLHFGLLFAAFKGEPRKLLKSPVARYYTAAMMIGIALVAWAVHGDIFQSWGESLRYGAFQLISLGTSTGFATADSAGWPGFAQLIMIFFTLQCACAGSTSGGIKTDRILIFWKGILKRVTITRHPHAVITARIGSAAIEDDVLEAVLLYIGLYVGVVFVSSLLLSAMGVDVMSAFSGAAACMGNVGPGFGTVSSLGNFSGIPPAGKWVLSFTMLMGRLEIFGVILFVSAWSK